MRVLDVPAAGGFHWIRLAWNDHFKLAPLGWIGLIAAWLIVTLGLLIVPFVGPFAASILQPVFFAGFMLACRAQDQGEKPQVGWLFAAFRGGNVRALISVGCVLLIGQFLIQLLVSALGLPDMKANADGQSIDFEAYAAALQGKEWIIFVYVAVSALLKGALWFAPALLAFNAMKASHAMRWSLYAFVSNFSALLVLGVMIFFIYMLSIFTLGLGLLIAIPLVAISSYTSYKASFREDGEAAPPGNP